jgi:hypothetical protein
MKKQVENRKHNFPDADLYLQCVEKIRLAEQDIAQFIQYGYNRERLAGFAARTQNFAGLPGDDELLGDQMLMTEKKDAAAAELKAAIRSLMTRVSIKYSNRSGHYRKFGTAKLGDMTDAQLLFCGRRVVRVARQQIDFLADVGVTEQLIRRVSDAAQAFERALNIQQDRISDRDIAVERRVEHANKLYEELMVLSNIGKDLWAGKDEERSERYQVYAVAV